NWAAEPATSPRIPGAHPGILPPAMPRSPLQLGLGLAVVAFGGYLIASPLLVAEVLSRPHATTSQMINLRASWGGTLAGVGAFIAWVPALEPRRRAGLGLLLGLMAGIGLARTVGFVLDGHPDALQWFWLAAEVSIVVACTIGLRRMAANPK